MAEQNILQAILAGWRDWPLPLDAPPKVLGPIPGGRTNRNIQLQVPGSTRSIILRINNPRGRHLGIDRDDEAQIVHTAALAGITPEPIYRDPAHRFALLPYVQARTWNPADMANPEQRKRLLALLQRVRRLSPATGRRSYLRYLQQYWTQLESSAAIDAQLRDRWHHFLPRLEAFDQGDWPAELTHHDLIAENILDTGSQLYLIDWEYAALGHADIDRWCIDPQLVTEPFIHELAQWTNDLWEAVLRLLKSQNSKG
ncbi:choline/ethanolamine kinase family protein [Gilvimarinus xylanilyticus]|uniref:Phosphotransferase family protein n=1 Tax=Gilvimarinus xylanilyticus TaxID=2944139 RepID=A0A9X2KU74_9GAMM|nr:choline/ethanolamine kinase family protein [Gilvimarinus xylanilyticus]MCP8899952.1 phosphotransferase family protein [Gilvimarinus xylanilyticus]